MIDISKMNLSNRGLSESTELSLSRVLNGSHNEFSENCLKNISSHRGNIVGTMIGTNYAGRFWNSNDVFGISLENKDTLLTYLYSEKYDREMIQVCTIRDGAWSKSFFDKQDAKTCSLTVQTIDEAAFQEIVAPKDQFVNMSMRSYDEDTTDFGKDVTRTETQELDVADFIGLFNELIAAPEKYSRKDFNK